MSGTPLTDKFPDLRPMGGMPVLFTINGVGAGLYGSRDHDEETGTYVKTHCVCVIFIPIIALGAYRVAYAGDGGYYFIGKQSLSGVAKGWNALVALCVLSLGGWIGFQAYYNSPDAVASRQVAAAEHSAANGQHSEAVRQLESVAMGPTAQAAKARLKLEEWLAAPPTGTTPPDKQALWRAAVRMQRSGRWSQSREQLCDQGLALAEQTAAAAPDVSLALLDESAEIDADAAASTARRRKLLARLHAANPTDVPLTVRLATAMETEGHVEQAIELLVPLQAALGDTEGARILGQHLAAEGKHDEAYLLLLPYCQTRLAQFRAAESALVTASEAAQQAAVSRLRNGQGDPGFYERYEAASQDEQRQMVGNYIDAALKSDSHLSQQREALLKEARIVPVALDLGVVQLARAQANADPIARKTGLEQAEQTFLAVGNAAGESDQYQLNLGKVYYWLGKPQEGRALFDAILGRNAGNFPIRIGLAHVLREVGAEGEARDLAEKIYGEEPDDDNKSSAASLRGLLARDANEEIEWLSRCRQEDSSVKASLALARARKAMQSGDHATAEVHMREAVALYSNMPEGPSVLNNAGISYDGLFGLSGDVADLRKAAELLDKSVGLQPDNSVAIINVAGTFRRLAIAETIADLIDLRLMGLYGDLDLMRNCYDDDPGRDALIAKLRQNPALDRALQHYERALLLAPKRATSYREAIALYAFLNDVPALQRLGQRIEEAQPDTQSSIDEMQRYLRGETDDMLQAHLAGKSIQAQRLAERWQTEPASERKNRSLAGGIIAKVEAQLSLSAISDKIDCDALVQQAELSHSTHPSSATRRGVMAALLWRADAELAAANPGYQALAASGKRILSPYDVLLFALDRPAVREAVVAHPDVLRAAKLAVESQRKFPKGGSVEDAMLMAPFDEAAAKVERERVMADDEDRLHRQLSFRLLPASPQTGVSLMRRLDLEGKAAEAITIREQLGKHGVKLP